MKTFVIFIKGLVQGVGFRPFVYRLALAQGVKGTVENRNDGVRIKVNASGAAEAEAFANLIKTQKPVASNIVHIEVEEVAPRLFTCFQIVKSENISDQITDVSPDIAVCSDCLNDMAEEGHRRGYPFINCTNCGPRFTIIKALPYDRAMTTMQPFSMCNACRSEYMEVMDRRFHAQPIACNDCGPAYTFYEAGRVTAGHEELLERVAECIDQGGVVAVKGMGGFFMACDAHNLSTVERLRAAKVRERKPFAVMVASLADAQKYVVLEDAASKALISWRRPIVLLPQKKYLAPAVNMGFSTLGLMLPYMPVHHQLFGRLQTDCIVLTSGNLSDEPIVTHTDTALHKLMPICDGLLTYNRTIQNRADDSVLFISNDTPRMIRRSRGFVPAPIWLNKPVDGIVAMGAELTCCFCVGKGNRAVMSQHIGDLKNAETYDFFIESYERFTQLYRVTPKLVACDLHPDYWSSKFAKTLGIPVIEVQHHHAHIAAVMAEYGLENRVIGIALDGTGLGDDGAVWGGEFFVCDMTGYDRHYHLQYMPLPGGDQVTKEPWRMALSYLYTYYGDRAKDFNLSCFKQVGQETIDMLIQAIKLKVNCPLTSSAGRLFDAVSALTGISPVSSFHAEAPMRLEAAIAVGEQRCYDYFLNDNGEISFEPMFAQIIQEMQQAVDVGIISARFHNTVVAVITDIARRLRKSSRIQAVCLSGGVFQNRYLLERSERQLKDAGFQVYINKQIPSNDGGLALGQLVIAARRQVETNKRA